MFYTQKAFCRTLLDLKTRLAAGCNHVIVNAWCTLLACGINKHSFI